MPKTKLTQIAFTDAERAFLNGLQSLPADQPVSASTLRAALRMLAKFVLGDAGDLFAPRERADNLAAINADPARKQQAAQAGGKASHASRGRKPAQ